MNNEIIKSVEVLTVNKNYAVGKTGYNSAHSYNLKNALTGVGDTLEIDYSMVLVSRGDLPAAIGMLASSAAAATLNLDWTNNEGKGKAKATDQLMVLVFCPALAEASYSIADATRLDETLVLDLPEEFSTTTVEVYTGWLSADGKEVSNSKYAGSVVVV